MRLSSKENLLVVKNQNLLGSYKLKLIISFVITNKDKLKSVFALFSIVCIS